MIGALKRLHTKMTTKMGTPMTNNEDAQLPRIFFAFSTGLTNFMILLISFIFKGNTRRIHVADTECLAPRKAVALQAASQRIFVAFAFLGLFLLRPNLLKGRFALVDKRHLSCSRYSNPKYFALDYKRFGRRAVDKTMSRHAGCIGFASLIRLGRSPMFQNLDSIFAPPTPWSTT